MKIDDSIRMDFLERKGADYLRELLANEKLFKEDTLRYTIEVAMGGKGWKPAQGSPFATVDEEYARRMDEFIKR
jgi:hypothetical protein